MLLIGFLVLTPFLVIGMVVGVYYIVTSPGLRPPLPRGLRWAFWFFAAFYLALIIAGPGREGPETLLWPLLLLASCLLLAFAPSIQWRVMSRNVVDVRADTLVRLDSDGNVVRRIDLSDPYKAHHSYRGFDEAIYVIRQGATWVRFTSSSTGAEAAVRALGLEWPPVARMVMP